jgi:hypothetical protein
LLKEVRDRFAKHSLSVTELTQWSGNEGKGL